MSFVIDFHFNKEPMNKITKTVNDSTKQFSIEGTLREETSIVDPQVIVEYDNPIVANYAYIPVFQRYYYIKNCEAYRSNGNRKLWKLTMHCDVLKTFSEGILGSPCIIRRSSSAYNMYLEDPYTRVYQNPIVGFKRFPHGFNLDESQFVLTIFGDRVQ